MSGRLRELWNKVASLFRKNALDEDFNDELAFHVEMAVEENIRAGMDEEEARRQAILRLGGKAQACEIQREARGLPWMDSLLEDIRYVLRTLSKSPGFSLAVIAALALGIGSAIAIVSAIDQTLLRKPYPHYERLAIFGVNDPNWGYASISYPIQVMPCLERGKSFEAFAISAEGRGSMNAGNDAFGVEYGKVNRDFFSVLNGKAALGRLFRPDEFAADSSNVMALHYQFWKEYFGGDPGVIGRNVVLEGRSYRIIGVLSREFSARKFPSQAFMPLEPAADKISYERRSLMAVARLRPGVTLKQANAEVAILSAASDASPAFREIHKKTPLFLKSLAEAERRQHFSTIHGALLGAVGFLFAIACINAIDLMLVRLSKRRRELGIRSALGSSRGRIIRLIFIESLTLNLLAGLVGICLAGGMQPFILSQLTGSEEALERGLSLDSRALLVAMGICLLSSIIVATVPSWKLPIRDPQSILKESGMALSEGRKLRRLRALLVVMSAAMAMVLLTGAGLMTRSVRHLMSINRGFDVVGKMAFWIDLPKPLQTAKPRQDFVKRMEERLRSLAGIRNVGASNTVPLAGMSAMPLTRPDGKVVLTGPSPVSPSFLRGMGMKLKNGRWLPSHPEGSPGVMLINQSMADQWFGKEDPVGRIIAIEPGSAWEVIGVVGNIREELRSNEAKPQFYFPIWQANRSDVITLMVDASLQPSAAFIQSIRKAIHEVDPRVGVRMPIELEKAARWQMNDERFTLFVLGLISSVSTLLAVLGLFSVMAYSVSQRMKDFGIRLALGAPARQLFLSVLSRGFMLGALGIVLGLLGSWVLTRYIKSLLYETSPLDPLVYSATALLMLLAVCLACWMPAHKAASADPSHLLRME